MIGVASRKAKRAESSLLRPASSPAPMVAPEREKPGTSPIAWDVPTRGLALLELARRSSEPPLSVATRAAPQALGAQQHDPVEGRGTRRRSEARRNAAQ